MELLGKWFIELIKIFIGPIIFLTIVLGICGMIAKSEKEFLKPEFEIN